jgi:hypothetical protein
MFSAPLNTYVTVVIGMPSVCKIHLLLLIASDLAYECQMRPEHRIQQFYDGGVMVYVTN